LRYPHHLMSAHCHNLTNHLACFQKTTLHVDTAQWAWTPRSAQRVLVHTRAACGSALG
jgi:hypothetical protein